MAMFNVKDQDKFGGQGGGGYFSLKEDREVGKVRILYDTVEDVQGFAVHQVEVDGKMRYVNCIHEYGHSKDDCPFCAAGKFTTVKYFVPVFNLAENRVQTWERGKSFAPEIQSKIARFPHMYQRVTEIERNGKKGDPKTSYQLYPSEKLDEVYLEDFEVQNPLGTIILNKTAEDMNYYLSTKRFPDANNSRPVHNNEGQTYSDDRPVRRPTSNTDRF